MDQQKRYEVFDHIYEAGIHDVIWSLSRVK